MLGTRVEGFLFLEVSLMNDLSTSTGLKFENLIRPINWSDLNKDIIIIPVLEFYVLFTGIPVHILI